MEIKRTYYGLKEMELTFSAQEVKKALMDYISANSRVILPDEIGRCDIEIYEEFTDDGDRGDGKKHEAKIVITILTKTKEGEEKINP